MSRRSFTRTATSIGVSVASLAVGVVGARAIQGDDDSAAAPLPEGTPVLVDAADAAATVDAAPAASYDDLIPVIEPVAVGTDPAIADLLLFPPDDGAGTDEAGNVALPAGVGGPGEPTVIGGALPPPGMEASGAPSDPTPVSDDDAAPPGSGGGEDGPILGEPPLRPPLWYWAADGGLFPFPIQFIDACAGPTPRPPDMLPPPRCPEGVGGTVTGDTSRPPLSAWVNTPHLFDNRGLANYVGCPAETPAPGDGEEGLTVVSSAPLARVDVHWRRRGTSGWTTQALGESALLQQQANWQGRVDAGVFAAGSGEIIGHCTTIARDRNQPFEVYATGADVYGRPFTTITATLADLTPEGRPPSVVGVDAARNQATVKSWTTAEGSVKFHWYPLAAGEEPSAPDCRSMLEFPLTERPGLAPVPFGVWDPQYRTGYEATFELPTGGGGVVCTTIFDTENTLRPLATEVFVVRGPRRQVATIDLMGLRLNDGVTIPDGVLGVAARYMAEYVPDDGCSAGWTNYDDPVSAPGIALSEVLWSCPYTPLPVDENGYVKVPITVSRRIDRTGPDPYQRSVVGIPLRFDDCTSGYCPMKPNEYYEVPIPTGDTTLRGCVFDCGGPPPSAGVAIVRVTYDVVGTRTTGSSVLLSSSDRDADPIGGRPVIAPGTRTDFVPTGGLRFSEQRAVYTSFVDRPVTLVGGRMDPEVWVEDSRCAGERPVEVLTTGPVTELEYAVTVACPSQPFEVFLTVRDAAGAEHEIAVAYDHSAQVIGRNVTTTVEFLDDTEGYDRGFLYGFYVGIANSSAVTPSYAWSWTGLSSLSGGAMCVEHGRSVARSARPIGELIVMNPEALYFGMTINLTTVCDGSGSGRGAIGEVSLGGSVDFESLADGEPIVLTSPADARLQVRITITASSWRLVD